MCAKMRTPLSVSGCIIALFHIDVYISEEKNAEIIGLDVNDHRSFRLKSEQKG